MEEEKLWRLKGCVEFVLFIKKQSWYDYQYIVRDNISREKQGFEVRQDRENEHARLYVEAAEDYRQLRIGQQLLLSHPYWTRSKEVKLRELFDIHSKYEEEEDTVYSW